MLRAHTQKARKHEGGTQVAQAEIGSSVAFAAKSENSVGAGINLATYPPGEMNPEKRKPRIGNGIDQRAYQRRTLRNQIVVLTAKRNNDDVRFAAGHAGDAVAE